MTPEILATSRGANSFYKKDFLQAASIYEHAYAQQPTAWWLAMEMYRNLILHKKTELSNIQRKNGHIVFTPDYRGNTYQGHMYGMAAEFNHSTTACNELPASEIIATLFAKFKHITVHQHWLKEIYKNTATETAAINAVRIHIGKLKALKALGAKIIWTLHNILDHDLDDHHRTACVYAIKEMSSLSDKILIHSKNSQEALHQITETRYPKEKFQLLTHPLYDDLETIIPLLPPELPKDPKGSHTKIIASIGMIRPYKGIADLAEAISDLSKDIKETNTHFIVAGRMMDHDAHQKLKSIKQSHPNSLTIIPRMLSESELAGLLRLADLIITPYRAILTSGSYYAATTFAKPVLAPLRGFFPEVITNGVDGFLYDGSIQNLKHVLSELMMASPEAIAQVGHSAKLANEHNTTKQFSENYFKHLESWTS